MAKIEMICTTCGFVGKPKSKRRGHFIIEILLWLFMILPGVLYTLWRLTGIAKYCPACGNPAMIPTSTPKGAELLANQKKTP